MCRPHLRAWRECGRRRRVRESLIRRCATCLQHIHIAFLRAQAEARQREEESKRVLAAALEAATNLRATSTSAKLGSGINGLENAIETAVAAGGVDASAARARVEELRAAQARLGKS